MKYRTIGTDPTRQREVSALALGAMWFGTATDEPTSYALLDRFVEAGGTFIDTSNNYAFWANGTQGGESEALLGRWLASSGKRDSVVVATKVGARPLAPSRDFRNIEGLSPAVVREQVERSRERLGIEQIDLYYAHLRDPGTPLADQVDGLASLVEDGAVSMLAPATSGRGSWSARGAWRVSDRPMTSCSSSTPTCGHAPTSPGLRRLRAPSASRTVPC